MSGAIDLKFDLECLKTTEPLKNDWTIDLNFENNQSCQPTLELKTKGAVDFDFDLEL